MASRRVFITGVGRGLGRAIALGLHDQGHEVWGSTRNGRTDLPIAGCVSIDLNDEATVVDGLASLAEQVESIDLLINNAGAKAESFGASHGRSGPFDLDAAVFNAVLEVNVTGPMIVTKLALPLLRAGADAMVLNISSQLGSIEMGGRFRGDTAYCVSKAALNMLGLQTAAALRTERIGVVLMHPGWVQTDMGGANASLSVSEAADSIISTVDALTFQDTGRFIRWDGRDHPW